MQSTEPRHNRLRELREERGEKLYDLAALVRRDTSVITRYETGDTRIPLDVLEILCAHYDVSADRLLGWDRNEAVAEPEESAA